MAIRPLHDRVLVQRLASEEKTKGGIIYEPNTGEELATAIASLLSDQDKVRKLGDQGRRVVMEQFSMVHMAEDIAGVYKDVA